MRDAAARQKAQSNVMILGNAASAYHAQLGHFPDGLQELADFCSQNPTLCTLDAALASGTDGSTNYYVGTANGGIWTVEAEPDCGYYRIDHGGAGTVAKVASIPNS